MEKWLSKFKPYLIICALAAFSFGVFVGCNKSSNTTADPYALGGGICPSGMIATPQYGCTWVCENLPPSSTEFCVPQADVSKYTGYGYGNFNYWQGFLQVVNTDGYKNFLAAAGVCDAPGTWTTYGQCHMWDGGGQVTFQTLGKTLPSQGSLYIYVGNDSSYGSGMMMNPISLNGTVNVYATNGFSLNVGPYASARVKPGTLNDAHIIMDLFWNGTKIATMEMSKAIW